MLKPDLANDPSPEDIRNFVVAVTGLACQDYAMGKRQYSRSGKDIVGLCAGRHRIFHSKMASSLYNNVMRTLETGKRDD